jgi:neutral/alkaline ceramidase-like enzyme
VKVGATSVDITPPLGMAMAGYGARVGGATGIHDRLHARILVAEGGDGTAVALVAADLIQIDPRLQQSIATEVLRTTGIPRERLQLAGTHTHSGPAFDEPSEVERATGRAIAEGVHRAWSDRREAHGAVGVGEVQGIAANRRPNGGPVDDRVTVARFDDVAGEPIATLVNYGCHATTLGPNNNLYSADFPGVACRQVQDAVGGVAIFSTGPQGDVNPGGYSPEGSMVGVVVPWRTFESAERYGHSLADVAVKVHRGLRPLPSDRVWGESRVAELKRKQLPDASVARAAADAAAAAADLVRSADLSADATYHAIAAAAYADLIAVQAGDPERGEPVRVRISALALGQLLHVGVGAELFVALGQRIRAALGDDGTCVAALCDGSAWYIPTADAFEIGGYEPNASFLTAGEGELLADAVVAMAAGAPPP